MRTKCVLKVIWMFVFLCMALWVDRAFAIEAIAFATNDVLKSTTEIANAGNITGPNGIDVNTIPAPETFIVAPTLGNGSCSNALGPNAQLSSGNTLAFFRVVFNRPTNFAPTTFNIDLLVDNEIQIFLNRHSIAIEDDTVSENFCSPNLGFFWNATGETENPSENDKPFDFVTLSLDHFIEGENELLFAVGNTGGPGNFSFAVLVEFDEDTDRDGIADALDNCPEDRNEDQSDLDLDGLGDSCDCAADDPNEPGEDGECPGCGGGASFMTEKRSTQTGIACSILLLMCMICWKKNR